MIALSELRDSAQKAFPSDRLKPARGASWRLAAEMGWLMMPLAESAGGLGLGRDATAVIHYEAGRVLGSAPLIPALLTIQALGEASELADREGWIERACAGEFVTMNLTPGDVSLPAGDAIDAALPAVPDADMASHVLVFGQDVAVLVPLDGAGVTATERPLWDESRRLFDISITGHRPDPGLIIARGEASRRLANRLQGELMLALAADSLGGARAALDMTVEYLKTRKQFDRPLAMFQALKHRCADLQTQIAAAEALLWQRAGEADATTADLGAAKALACDVYRRVTEEAIQLHGGIGLTEEHNCHLFMKRAMLNLQLGGDPDCLREAAGRQAIAAL